MATGAILGSELAFVRIQRVTIGASYVRHRFLEVAALVTSIAIYRGVGTVQREVRAAVVEGRRHPDLLPAGGAVTALAASLECSVVRILMAIATRLEGKVLVPRVDFAFC